MHFGRSSGKGKKEREEVRTIVRCFADRRNQEKGQSHESCAIVVGESRSSEGLGLGVLTPLWHSEPSRTSQRSRQEERR
jgi:hypothetical protein